MKDSFVIVFTMKSCPFCTDFKEMLQKENIEFYDRDIDEFKEEYDLFTQLTNNEMIPAVMIIETEGDKNNSFLYAPERDYNELSEAVEIIKKHILKS